MSDHQLPLHSLSRTAFHEVCVGVAGGDTMAVLSGAEYSRRLLLLRALVDAAASAATTSALADPEPAWDVLAAVQRRAPEIVRELILYPPFGVWLRRAIVRLRDPDRSGTGEFGYLNTIAAAMAIRADVPCVLVLPVWHGAIVLPTVGRLRLPTRFPAGTAELRHSGDGTLVTAMGGRVSISVDTARAGDSFRPAPAHVVTTRGLSLALWLDDTDPYREFAEPLPPNEMGPTELLEWRKLLDEAWDTVVRRHPGWAAELAAGLHTVTPVVDNLTDGGFSSAAAIGAIAVPVGLSSTAMAESFVHEFQHSKFNALAHLVNLADADATGRYYAPWRDDPRPIGGMLHGIYAFVAVAEFWLARDDEADHTTAMGEFRLAYRRQQVGWALDALVGADGLTSLGAELVAAVRERLAVCARADVDAQLVAIADRMIVDHYASWRLRNIRPDRETIAALVGNWRRGRPAAPLSPGSFATRRSRTPSRPGRQELLRARIADPAGFAGAVRAAARSGDPMFAGDAAYARGDYGDALARYLAADRTGDALIGVGLCLRAAGNPSMARAFLLRPEIGVAVCTRIGADADPVEVASWLSPAIGMTRVGAP